MDKFLTKENIIIFVAVFTMLIQSNYFATKLDIANLELKLVNLEKDCTKYTDDKNKDLLYEINIRFDKFEEKIDKLVRR